jgi:hypothetical protein
MTGRESGDVAQEVLWRGHKVYKGMSGRVLWPGQRWQSVKGYGALYAFMKAAEWAFKVQMIANIVPVPGLRASPIGQALGGGCRNGCKSLGWR